MIPICINQMTIPRVSTIALLDVAKSLNCAGVELRNDLASPLFDGKSATSVRAEAGARGLRIFALAEVNAFNDNTNETCEATRKLVQLAQECGAEAVALIPRIADSKVTRHIQRSLLRDALTDLQPLFEGTGITALIEPLGFSNSSLRLKADAVAVLDEMGRPACFALIHDTFHHTLSGETAVFADATQIVHISGVADPFVATVDMTDAHRGLVGENDRLDSVAQITELRAQGYNGPVSFEAFAPEVHEMTDPAKALSASTTFITSCVTD